MIALIKRLISLALLALVANATWHVFLAYSAHYKFKDAVNYAAEHRGDKTDDALHDQILQLAANEDLPVQPDDVVGWVEQPLPAAGAFPQQGEPGGPAVGRRPRRHLAVAVVAGGESQQALLELVQVQAGGDISLA